MSRAPRHCVALLRGINVGKTTSVRMAELRELCTRVGWEDVQSYVQSGNVVFRSRADEAALEVELEQALEAAYGRTIHVVVRSATAWRGFVGGNPYPEASEREPNLVMLALSKRKANPDALPALRARAVNGERIEATPGALWFRFERGVAQSKLTPALLERLVGSPVTMRNWRTVLALHEMLAAR